MRLLTLLIIGCGTPNPPGPANTSTPAVRFTLPADADLGWLALVPQSINAKHSWIPAANYTAIAVGNGELERGRLFDAAGKSAVVEPIGPTDIRYGCDNNQLAVTILATTDKIQLAPGPAWLPPTTIEPKALPIRPEISTASKLHYAIGPVTLDLQKTGDETGTLAVSWRTHPVHDEAFKRVLMSGADNAPIRLNDEGEVAVPRPIAAWSFAGEQAALVVFRTPGYEGSNLDALVIGEAGARRVESLTTYLYYCAF